MKTSTRLLLTLSISLLFILNSCVTVTPVNLSFDSATMLDKKTFEVQGNAAYYPNYDQINFGGKVGYGVNNFYNVKFRYEGMMDKSFSPYGDTPSLNWSFIELDNKFRLASWCAFSLPFGVYLEHGSQYNRETYYQIDPKVYFTATDHKYFEISLIPKCHFIFGEGEELKILGISGAFGLSTNLDKWAFRPEVGWDELGGISFGTALTFNIHLKNPELTSGLKTL